MIMERRGQGSVADQADPIWKMWGPYLSERQWGTVREDYSPNGNAWGYFTHDQARSRAYRWGEDGLAGISDDGQRLCFALALWNGRDPIIKERAFGLTNAEGNHGEDVKEYYFYLDSTPTHSFMKYLYKYPQAAFPYNDLVQTNARRTRRQMEYELLDTGVFDDDRYFDVFVEYAKASPQDILIKITAHNRGPEAATLHLLPTLWFRNTWWARPDGPRPWLGQIADSPQVKVVKAWHPELGDRYLYCANARDLLFTENETNCLRLSGTSNPTPFVKDGINDYFVHRQQEAVNPARHGTKVAAHYELNLAPDRAITICLRLTNGSPQDVGDPAGLFGGAFGEVFHHRQREADEFYDSITPENLGEDQRRVMRQALAGMLWSKQYYCYPVDRWLRQHGIRPMQAVEGSARNIDWHHMTNEDIISMPDKWEYPWYAAWDLAFHSVALSMVDLPFAKQQLNLMLEDRYLHPNGQMPAYEWNFGDVNPPVHAFAALYIFDIERAKTGHGDIPFLERTFQSLLLNFAWWVNRKDAAGRNVFEGGFLGLDNISVFDRSSALPTGGRLEQADGTAWMALYSALMFRMSLELAANNPLYEDMALKFCKHYLSIFAAISNIGPNHSSMWDEQDGFFYDLLRLPDNEGVPLKVRSIVGLLPLCATAVLDASLVARFPRLAARIREFVDRSPEIVSQIGLMREPGAYGRRLICLLNLDQIRRTMARLLDENEFLSEYGIRSLSRWHRDHPYVFDVRGQEWRVDYLPAESDSGLFGGNSNWRGPIWMPVNIMIIRSLLAMYAYAGDDYKVECPTGSGRMMTLFEVAQEITRRLGRIFVRGADGRRPVYGGTRKFQEDPHWKDYILFYEYFHGDNGAGLGASHQTGWTGLIAPLMQLFGILRADELLAMGIQSVYSGAFARQEAESGQPVHP